MRTPATIQRSSCWVPPATALIILLKHWANKQLILIQTPTVTARLLMITVSCRPTILQTTNVSSACHESATTLLWYHVDTRRSVALVLTYWIAMPRLLSNHVPSQLLLPWTIFTHIFGFSSPFIFELYATDRQTDGQTNRRTDGLDPQCGLSRRSLNHTGTGSEAGLFSVAIDWITDHNGP